MAEFYNESMEEKIYKVQPESFESQDLIHLVCKLKQSICDLRQASHQ